MPSTKKIKLTGRLIIMKQALITIFFTICIALHLKAQISGHQKDSLINLSGNELRSYATLQTAGYVLTTGGTVIMTVAAISPIKVSATNGKPATTKPNAPLIILGGAMYLFGFGCLIASPDRVSAAGYLMQLASGQKVIIPIRHKEHIQHKKER
jgi:hypothetical protein